MPFRPARPYPPCYVAKIAMTAPQGAFIAPNLLSDYYQPGFLCVGAKIVPLFALIQVNNSLHYDTVE
jgi:hypothetical protein